MLKFQNARRGHKVFHPGKEIYVKNNRRRKDHRSYRRYEVKEDQNDKILKTTNKVIHKDNIRNIHVPPPSEHT